MSNLSQSPESTSVMFGRSEELGTLGELLKVVVSGMGRIVLLSGDAGIGKTRLVEQLESTARGHGALILWGYCRDGTGTPPFWPWRQVARELDVPEIDHSYRINWLPAV